MKKPTKAVAALLAANPDAKPRQPACTGTGEWLYWHAPSGETIPVGVAIHLTGITYRQIITADDASSAATALWGATIAWQLGKMLAATSAAVSAGQPLPAGISAEPIPIVNGDNPGTMLDTLWQHGVAQSILLKKKPPSVKAERSIAASNTREAEPAAPAQNTPGQAAQEQAPAKPGASSQKK